ncbi:MAG: Lin0512 family protein [Actinomycetota bacterium]
MPPESVFPAFIEMGLGVDLHGEDATKAARRAVREAIGRNSLPGMWSLLPDADLTRMRVEVTVAVPHPEAVDTAAVAAEFPYGTITVTAVEGGARTSNGNARDTGSGNLICAVAVIAVGW